MKRREFICLAGCSVVMAPLALRAQERVRRVGVLMNLAVDDPLGQARNGLFQEGLRQLGWTPGQNVQIDTRWAAGDPDYFRRYSAELVALAPDVIVATTGPTVQALQQVTRTIPIVFAQATDPVGAGLVQSLARPGGNTTGFTQHEFSLSGKLVEVLREIAPHVKRAAVLRDPRFAAGVGQLGALQGAAQSLRMELFL